MTDASTRREPEWLTESMLLAIHAQQIERYGGAHGVLDANVVGSALARPVHRSAYDAEADIADFAASYLVGFAQTQGFNDGNKRTALAAALVLLRLNGYALHAPGRELYALVMRVSTNQAGDDVVAAYLRSRM